MDSSNTNGNCKIFPGITASLVNQNISLETPTTQGYQHQIRCGIRSTKERAGMAIVVLELAVHETCSKVVDLPHLVCADKTGKIPSVIQVRQKLYLNNMRLPCK